MSRITELLHEYDRARAYTHLLTTRMNLEYQHDLWIANPPGRGSTSTVLPRPGRLLCDRTDDQATV